MRFEWDENKDVANSIKHKIWFEEARTIWADSRALEFYDPDHSVYEDRFIRIGFSGLSRLLTVVFCERSEELMIRIISARKSTTGERSLYEERI